MKYKIILDTIVKSYKQILEDNLVGIYLHGSLAMGCATENSDIDFLVVVNKPVPFNKCRKLINAILKLDDVPTKGIEMSIVLKKYCLNLVYPVPFELHYGDYYKDRYINDKSFICGGYEDEDLAAHFKVTKHRGICLYGSKIDDVFKEVPDEVYIKSVFYDINDAKEHIKSDAVYHILNLCRTFAYIKDRKILSKLEGGLWAVDKVDNKFVHLINNAVNTYSCQTTTDSFDKDLLNEFVEYMYSKIKN